MLISESIEFLMIVCTKIFWKHCNKSNPASERIDAFERVLIYLFLLNRDISLKSHSIGSYAITWHLQNRCNGGNPKLPEERSLHGARYSAMTRQLILASNCQATMLGYVHGTPVSTQWLHRLIPHGWYPQYPERTQAGIVDSSPQALIFLLHERISSDFVC